MKTHTSGRAGCSARRSTGCPSTVIRFAAPDRQFVLEAVGAGRAQLDPRRWRAEAHDLALVVGPARAPGRAEVHGLEQVRLAGTVGAVDDGQALRELDPLVGVAAKVAQMGGANDHRDLTR
jgi:hypothetical protein